METDNTTTDVDVDTENQPPAKAEPDFQKEFDEYARAAKCEAEDAALEALPFIAKRSRYSRSYWAPPSIREVTFEEKEIAFEYGTMYAQMLALHCRNYKTDAFIIKRIITSALEYGAQHPRKGAELRNGFLQALSVFALAGMRIRQH